MRGLSRNDETGERPEPPSPPLPRRGDATVEPAKGQAPADFFSSLAVLGRRWKVVVIGLAVTALVAMGALVAIPPSYKANGSSFFAVAAGTSTSPGSADVKTNPYLAFGGSLKVTAELMAKSMNGEQLQQKVVDGGGTGHYVADLAAGDAPVLTISATGKTPDEALKTEQVATAVMEDELKSSQIELGAQGDLIRTKGVLVPERASKQQTSRIRALIGVLVLGIGATVMAAFLVESIAQHRAKNRLPRPVESDRGVRPLAGRRGEPAEPRVDLRADSRPDVKPPPPPAPPPAPPTGARPSAPEPAAALERLQSMLDRD